MPMKKPSQPMPSSDRSYSSPMPSIIPDPSIRGASFDQLINNRGIRFLHKRATPCPNMKSLDASNHMPNCPHCDGNGFLYYAAREIIGVFSGNSLDKIYEAQGVWEVGSAVITFPAEYDDGTQADFLQFDRLEVADFEVRLWELKEYEPTSNGRQRLRYPITDQGIDYMSSVDDAGTLVVYEDGVHFTIVDGEILWDSAYIPSYNITEQRGEVLTISYYAKPVFNVVQLMHEMRVTQEMVNGSKIAIRLPYNVLVKRDFLMNPPESTNP